MTNKYLFDTSYDEDDLKHFHAAPARRLWALRQYMLFSDFSNLLWNCLKSETESCMQFVTYKSNWQEQDYEQLLDIGADYHDSRLRDHLSTQQLLQSIRLTGFAVFKKLQDLQVEIITDSLDSLDTQYICVSNGLQGIFTSSPHSLLSSHFSVRSSRVFALQHHCRWLSMCTSRWLFSTNAGFYKFLYSCILFVLSVELSDDLREWLWGAWGPWSAMIPYYSHPSQCTQRITSMQKATAYMNTLIPALQSSHHHYQ